MIDFVNTPPFLRIALQVAMATMHLHIAQTGLWVNVFTNSGGPREQFGTNSKLSLGYKVGQIGSRGKWFEAEISLFILFFLMIFTLFIKLSLIFLNIQMK